MNDHREAIVQSHFETQLFLQISFTSWDIQNVRYLFFYQYRTTSDINFFSSKFKSRINAAQHSNKIACFKTLINIDNSTFSGLSKGSFLLDNEKGVISSTTLAHLVP